MRKLYDFEAWFAKGKFSLVRGVDFSCSTWAITQQIRSAATLRELKIIIVENDDGIEVTVKKTEEPVCPK